MGFKLLTFFFFFLFLVRPEATYKTNVVVLTYVVMKLQKLIWMTYKTRKNHQEVHYYIAPGQAFGVLPSQTYRSFRFALDFILIVVYSRFIAQFCTTTETRNTVAAYTVVFTFLHSWEHLLYGIYGFDIVRNSNLA
ncbi:Protein CBG14499 [Caenorhabditis briggsae]|nr:Protein CBG14499 [Caenorhabditis briggsae]CAP33001.1 Protein CBG14499 [Caenorhabditis briggsae]